MAGVGMTDEQMAEALLELMDDGDCYKVSDDVQLRLRVLPDNINPFDEYECYGRVEASRRNRVTGRDERPEGFDGNAEKLSYGNAYGPTWWQPPVDVKRTDPGFDKCREAARELIAFGMSGYVIEKLEGTDAYGKGIVTETASLWGIEPFPDDAYRREVIGDLLGELATV